MTTTKFQLQIFLLVALVSVGFAQEQTPTEDENTENTTDASQLLTKSQIWGFGFLAGFGISLIGFLTAMAIVCFKKMASDGCFEIIIKFLFSLAFGALLGDAMIHILGEAYKADGSDSRVVAAIFIGTLIFFIILERIFEACGITHQHWHNEDCHDDHQGAIKHHNHPKKIYNEDFNPENMDKSVKLPQIATNNIIAQPKNCHMSNCKSDKENVHDHAHDHAHDHHHSHDHNHSDSKLDSEDQEQKSCWENLKGKGTAGYMNLMGSLIHNFMDGLALGVGFATGDKKIFVPILVAIIAHEIPREMGDVAILMTNKFNSMQTILCNGFVNLLALVGVIVGLAVADVAELAQMYILVAVAANFIYIAADIWKNMFKNEGVWRNVVEFFGFGVGIAAMYLILLLESDGQETPNH